tara:strand:+ start:1043 stop:2074 length:1032 start_codon:yes stop_codon:yes gene_type:complete
MLLIDKKTIDVRSEHEFEKGTIPNSISMPILDDNQHKLVGTDYKKNGKDSAIALGTELVSGEKKKKLIDDWIRVIKKHGIEYIFCKRGGLRSKTAKKWLKEKNVDVKILKGGYKAYRKSIVEQHENLDHYRGDWFIITGFTGSGKTSIIRDLNSSIDLEDLAKHRGSTFGALSVAQPTQQNFENKLTYLYQKKCDGNIILEAESRNIGSVALPGKFYEKMRTSKYIFVEADIETRVNNIANEYISKPLKKGISKSSLLSVYQEALGKINKRLGTVNYITINNEMKDAFGNQKGSHKLWIRLLLENYYDKLYKHKLDEVSKQIIYSSDWSSCKNFLYSIDNSVS